tara:strand:+ start:88 stop:291 length:204 start_codon:yes stop_codon:yes gene_type:complete
MNKLIFVIFVFVLLFSYGCSGKNVKQEDYQKCTSVCASVIENPDADEAFITMEICMEECKKKFLEQT